MKRSDLLKGLPSAASTDPKLTLEDANQTSNETEREYCYYVEVADFSELFAKAASVLDQEQWNFPTNGRGTLRVRKEMPVNANYDKHEVTPSGELSITQTFKVFKDKAYTGVSNAEEYTFDIDEKAFNAFRQLSESGMIKRRLNIPFKVQVEGRDEPIDANLEVDLFFDSEGHYQPWAKIDLETKAVVEGAPNFPFHVGEVILPTADKEVRNRILNTYFLTFVNKAA